MDLSVVYKPPENLIPYVNNAKQHEPAQVDQIAASIKEFGFNNPILLDSEDGVIAGHGRLEAAKKLGMDRVPTIDLSHLSDTQRKAYILADNRLSEVNTSWDFELVSLELESLQEMDFDIELTGFGAEYLEVDPPVGDLDTGNPGDTYHETHSIIVICADSDEQEQTFNRLIDMGMTCKVVSN